jgi:hypothetical protein
MTSDNDHDMSPNARGEHLQPLERFQPIECPRRVVAIAVQRFDSAE